MARGQKRSTQERLNDVIAKRTDRRERYNKADASDAETERALREEIVRAEVTARHLNALEEEINAELAKLESPAVAGNGIGESFDEIDETGRAQFATA